jgi:putative aldouronate transport system permease protein
MFKYLPMYGISVAFFDYRPFRGLSGSEFVGLKWFRYVFTLPDFYQILVNTLVISFWKIVANTGFSVLFALLLNEVACMPFKRTVQTLAYLPHFLSWVIFGGIIIDIASTKGAINQIIASFGGDPVFFLGSDKWFRFSLVFTDTWKDFGWGAIIYLAALAGINPELYESAVIDGANRFQQMRRITLPLILPTMALLMTLKLGHVLDAGFGQVLMLYNPSVYKTGDIIGTFVYRTGLLKAQFSMATAVGLFKSLVGLILVVGAKRAAERVANYRLF